MKKTSNEDSGNNAQHSHPVGDVVKKFGNPLELFDFMESDEKRDALKKELDEKYGEDKYHAYVNISTGEITVVRLEDEAAEEAKEAA